MIKPIPDFPGYFCDQEGKVYSNKSGHLCLRRSSLIGAGYASVQLWKNGKNFPRYIHRLVLEVFSGLKPGHECNHKDGNKTNNSLENLEWVTKSQNQRHRCDVLGRGNKKGINAKLTDEQIQEVIILAQQGFSSRKIALIFNVHCSTISRYLKLKR